MKFKEILLKNKYLLAILLFTAVIRLIPVIINPVLPGLDVFYHQDVTALFLSGQFGLSQAFSLSRIVAGGYPFLFHAVSSVLPKLGLPLKHTFQIIPAVLSTASVYLFYLFCREFTSKKKSLLASFFMSTAPVVVLRTSQAMPELLGLVFLFSALLFLVKFHKNPNLLNLLVLSTSTILYFFTHRSVLLLFILLLISIFTIFKDQLKPKVLAPLIALGLGAGIYFNLFTLLFEQLKRIPFEPVTAKGYLLASGILTIPATFGIALSYKKGGEYKRFLLHWSIVFALIGLMSFRFRDPFLMFPLSIFASFGVYDYFKKNYEKYFEKLMVFLAIVLILQAFVISVFFVPAPSQQEYRALSWIEENTPEDSVVLSWKDEGYWLIGIADRKDIIIWNRLYEGLYGEQPSIEETKKTYKEVIKAFRTVNSTKSEEIIKEYNASYLYVSSAMREERDALKYGLLERVNRSSSEFEKVYEAGNNTVYKVDLNEAQG